MTRPARPFRLDVAGYRLLRGGRVVALERQPMELLILLAERRGELVTRDDIAARLWGQDVFVDLENSINRIVRKLRTALGDAADQPRYIETVVGKGYRLVGSLDQTIRSLAILPFANLSGDPEEDYLADGMTEELITRTGRIGGLRVISRTSVNRLKNSNRPLEDLARELEVEAVVEGSVSRNGPRVRITVKLIQVLPERPLWSDSYDGDLQDLPAIQREITEAIARHVGAEDRLPSRRQPPRPVHPDALDAYLQGRFHWNRRTAGDLHAALQHFRRATEIDPAYARAHAGLADTYNVLLSWTIEATRPAEGAPCAKASARAALALDPDLSEAHTALAGVLHLYEWDWRRAEAEYRRAIELNPGYASAHHWYSQLLQQRGRWAECLIEAQKAQQLDPLSPAIAASWGWRLHLAGRGDEAVAQLTRALRVSPDFVVAHWYLGQVHEHQRRFADARAALERAVALSSGAPIYLAALAHSRALAGDRAGAVDVLGSLGEMAASRYVSPYNFALIHAALGDDDRALGWLEQAHRERAAWMVYVRLDPRLARLHGHPAFERIARAVGV